MLVPDKLSDGVVRIDRACIRRLLLFCLERDEMALKQLYVPQSAKGQPRAVCGDQLWPDCS